MNEVSVDWRRRAAEAVFSIRNIIDGKVSDTCAGDVIHKRAPRDASLFYQLHEGSGSEVEAAITSARAAFVDKRWRGKALAERQGVLLRLADLLEANAQEFALYECLDVGKPISHALGEVSQAAATLRESVHFADKFYTPLLNDGAYCVHQRRKPVGVVAAIIGWNYPLIMAANKVGPALVMGNSLILKPSEFTSLSAWRLAELALEAGLPDGVFNIVHGTGRVAGTALTRHGDVDMASFTGSSATGKQVQIAAGQSNMKRLMLECGGKSPYLVFDDYADGLDYLAADIVATAFQNQGANCMAGSRLLLQDTIAERVLEKVIEETQALIPGDPLDPATNFGAIVNEPHLEKILKYIESGEKDGAQRLYGGERVCVDTENGSDGYYLTPSIFSNIKSHHPIFQEEIFGPVLSVSTFKDEGEAIDLANNTCFGLAAYAATRDMGRAQRLSDEIRTGSFYVQATASPFGAYHEIAREGHRESGFGAEYGFAGLASYSVTTTVHQWT